MLFDPANLTYWLLLGIGILLFLLMIISGSGDDDLGLDADVDADVEVEAEFSSLAVLSFLGFGKAPLLILLAIDFSVWGLVGWMLNVILGNIIGSIPVSWLGGVVLIVSLTVSLAVGSLIARPLGRIFANFSEDTSSERLIGCSGTVISKKLPYYIEGRLGQADVVDAAGNRVTVSVSLPQWARVVPGRGQHILLIEQHQDGYMAIAKDSSDQDKWLNNNQESL